MSKTKIEWADAVWNPVTGCTKLSPGCANCYAERMSKRLAGRYGYPEDDPFRVTVHEDRLDEPLKWKNPKRIFVCSMGDLFHPDLKSKFISNTERLDEIFAVMLGCAVFDKGHTFLILTKRPERMREYFASRKPADHLFAWASAGNFIKFKDEDVLFEDVVFSATCRDWDENGRNSSGSEYRPWGYIDKLWPLPNVWLGVSAENQKAADERIPVLLDTPAVVRWVSLEPLLGPVDLSSWFPWDSFRRELPGWKPNPNYKQGLNWIVAGGESGPNARPMHPEWVRDIRDQCLQAGTPFFFKQWGEWRECEVPDQWNSAETRTVQAHGTYFVRLGKKSAGRTLDGQIWDQYPEVVECLNSTQ